MDTWERINLLFSAGSRPLKSTEELSLAELLLANRLPPSLFQAYDVPGDGRLHPIPITTPVSSIPEKHTVLLQCIRNTDLDSLRANTYDTVCHDPVPVAALWDYRYAKSDVANRVHLVDDESLRRIVFSKIASFLADYGVKVPLVAGISGGGDSNTLVQGMRQHVESSSLSSDQVVCFTLVMDPLWPESAADRARELCAEAGFTQRVLGPDDIAALLGMQGSPMAMWQEFAAEYGDDTSHFFGTFFVNLVGRRLCEQMSASHLVVGYNREDVMAELLFCLLNGRRPMPYPVRAMGSVTCILPVWDVPKHHLDACYPRYSESNYTERVDTTTPQRSSIYFLAHCLDALVPQMSISLLRGVEQLMTDLDGWQHFFPVPGTPLMHTGRGDEQTQSQVLDLLARYFPQWETE